METTQYADQRAHDVFWMTAAEREEYERQMSRVVPKHVVLERVEEL